MLCPTPKKTPAFPKTAKSLELIQIKTWNSQKFPIDFISILESSCISDYQQAPAVENTTTTQAS